MHDQSEFQCDPFQDRPAEKGGQEWVELEAWPFEALVSRRRSTQIPFTNSGGTHCEDNVRGGTQSSSEYQYPQTAL